MLVLKKDPQVVNYPAPVWLWIDDMPTKEDMGFTCCCCMCANTHACTHAHMSDMEKQTEKRTGAY